MKLIAEASICLSNFISVCPDELLEYKFEDSQYNICK